MEQRQGKQGLKAEQVVGQHIPTLAKAEKPAIPLTVVSAVLTAVPIFFPLTFPFAWFGLVPFLFALQTNDWKVTLTVSLIFGFVFHGATNYWLIPTISGLAPFANSTPQIMAVWAVIGFVALLILQSLFTVLFGVSVRFFGQTRKGFPFAVIVGVSWFLTEWLRSLGTFGYPWALLASTQVSFLPLVQIVAWIGSFGLSGVVAFVNALFFEWLRWKKSQYLVLAFSFLVALSLLGWLDGKRVTGEAKRSPHLTVAVVQGNFGKERWRPDVTFEELREILRTHLSLSEKAVKRGAKLIVWSETALPWHLKEDGFWGYGASQLQGFAERNRTVLLVGAGEWQDEKSYNSCFVFAPKGTLKGSKVARKTRLVPFGEYLPGREFFPWLTKILPHAPNETAPGENIAEISLQINGKTVKPAIVICFESLFPFHIRQLVGNPLASTQISNLIVVITNDSWFGNTLAPYHHARVAVLRAVEMRRAVVRCAGTGISLIVTPVGKSAQVSKWDERCILVGSVPLVKGSSCYQILGDLPLVVIAMATLLWLQRKPRK